ncbi:chemotaxis protein CheW [Litoribrevibacter euphylliae]|uniref:Chemotaxis protein CheW n=1 Tax=Litoribrevibacter euphylliae TaxID=1834034 RepID=A0ABV7HAS8_9GAMM
MDKVAINDMEYLTCTIQDEGYAIDVHSIQEILPMMWIHRVPNAPDYLEGMLNRRGSMIPIIDLAKRIGLERNTYPPRTRIVLVGLDHLTVGLIIDQVHDIHSFVEGDHKSGVLNQEKTPFLQGVLVNGDSMIQILIPDKMLSNDEQSYLMEFSHDKF